MSLFDFFLAIIVASYLGIIIVLYLRWVSSQKTAEIKLKDLYQKIFRRMVEDSSFGRDELRSLLEYYNNECKTNISFAQFLHGVCSHFSLVDVQYDGSGSSSYKESVVSATKRISKILEEEERVAPFDENGSDVRYTLKDIAKGIETGDNNFARERLSVLSSIIKTQEDKYHKDHKLTKWSFYIALIGVVISILISVFSLNRSVHVADSDWEKIKEMIINQGHESEVR